MMKSSCEMAQYFVEGKDGKRGDAIRGWGEQFGAALRLNNNTTQDGASASANSPGEPSPIAEGVASADEETQKKIIANFVYKAMREAGVGSWFGASSEDLLLQDIMSITGTAVGCIAGQDSCPTAGETRRPGEYEVIPHNGLLTLADLIDGARGGDSGGSVMVLRCQDSGDRCLDVQTETLTSFTSVTDLMLDTLLGAEGDRDTGGLIGKIAANADDITDEERNVLNATQAGAWILDLTAKEPALARAFVKAFAHQIAASFLYSDLVRVLDSVRAAVSQSGADPAGTTYSVIIEARRTMDSDYRAIMERRNAVVEMQQFYSYLSEMAPRRGSLAVAGSSPTR